MDTLVGVRHAGQPVIRENLLVYDVLQLSSQTSSCVASIFSFERLSWHFIRQMTSFAASPPSFVSQRAKAVVDGMNPGSSPPNGVVPSQ